MSEAPAFWWRGRGPVATTLAPVGFLYGRLAAMRMARAPTGAVDQPVVCVGNFVAGGAGKTPVTLAVAEIAARMGRRPGFLSRGYGGSVSKPTLIDLGRHNAHDVGDEPLLLAERFPTVVTPDRAAGAKLLSEGPVDMIIMDDGFQNPALRRDLSFVVVDSHRGVGNALPIPAGPLRADLRSQVRHAGAVVVLGDGKRAGDVIRLAARSAKPILRGRTVVLEPQHMRERRTLAYAAIADPEKFYRSLEASGAEIVERRSFGDHHPFTAEECEEMMSAAERDDLALVTTEKDAARLRRAGDLQSILLNRSHVLRIEVQFDEPHVVERLLRGAIDAARRRRTT